MNLMTDAEFEESEQDKDDAGHDGGDGESFDAVLADDAGDDDDEGSRGAAYLDVAAAEERDDEAADDGGDESLFGRNAAGYAECDGEGEGDDADDDAGHQVGGEFPAVVVFQRREKFGLEIDGVFHDNGCLSGLVLLRRRKYNKIYSMKTESGCRAASRPAVAGAIRLNGYG